MLLFASSERPRNDRSRACAHGKNGTNQLPHWQKSNCGLSKAMELLAAIVFRRLGGWRGPPLRLVCIALTQSIVPLQYNSKTAT
eukprot:6211846-Pleurochrysis_carterae.AAC.2